MLSAMFGRSFNSGRCKTLLKLAVSRIKLLKNKRDIQLKQMRRDLAFLLQTNQDPSARIRVEHIIREGNIITAYEIIELFCELIAVRLPIIESQRNCPIDLQEAISSLIFAAPRCTDLPELLQIRSLFVAKYGKEFVTSAAELRPGCGVNRLVIEKLSVRAPTGEAKLNMMKNIAVEHKVDWDPTDSEAELLRPPEDLLEGPNQILSASQIPVLGSLKQSSVKDATVSAEQDSTKASLRSNSSFGHVSAGRLRDTKSQDGKQFIPFVLPVDQHIQGLDTSMHFAAKDSCNGPLPANDSLKGSLHGQSSFGYHLRKLSHDMATTHSQTVTCTESVKLLKKRYSESYSCSDYKHQASKGERFKDVAAAAQAAVESADRAAAAARAAVDLASESLSSQFSHESLSSSASGSAKELFSSRLPNKDKDCGDGLPLCLAKPMFGDFFEEEFNPNGERTNRNGVESFSRSHLRGDTSVGDEDEDCLPQGNRPVFDFPRFDDSPTNLQDGRKEHNIVPPQEAQCRFDRDLEAHFTTWSPSSSNVPIRGTSVHPKLPDYDDLSAHFQSLKSKR